MSDFNLGTVTAYGYAKDKGYTGTEDEYAELMASYADVAEQAAESATQAAASATTATAKASEAAQSATAAAYSKTAAETAQGGAETAAQTATTKAGEASASATTASGKATEATTAAGTATTKASEATTAATTATTKAGEASTSATNAAASATRAQEILDSIPEDYSQMSEDVSDLKDGLTAVESDVTDLKDDLRQEQTGYIVCESGSFYDEDGITKYSSNARIRNAVPLSVSGVYSLTIPNGYQAWVFRLNKSGTLISAYGSWVSGTVSIADIATSGTKFINFAIKNASTPSSDISGEVETVSNGLILTNAIDQKIESVASDLDEVVNPIDSYTLFYTNNRPDNFVNAEELITGYYINNSGVQTISSSWTCTPFVDIDGIEKLYGQNIGLGAYYDANKAFISSFTLGNSNDIPPESAKYIRVSISPQNAETAIICPHDFYREFAQDYPVNTWKIPKKGYESGYIRFTVPVNNTVATYNDTTETNHEGTPDYVDVDCVLSLPIKYKPVGKPCKLVMMCHGAGKGVSGTDNWTTNADYNALVSMFISYGYAVFDCNGFKNDVLGWSFWGNQRGIEAWRKAYLYVTDNYNVEKTFSIYAFSMGGLTAMNLAFQGFPNINAIAMGSPVLDLHEVWNATDGTQAVLKVLYGLGDTWDESKVVGNNPYKHITTIDNVDYCPYKLPPIKIWSGSTETNNSGNPAIEKEIAKSFVNAIVNSGGYAFYREVSGRGHEICYGRSTIVNAEIMTFIERYERVEATYY